MIDFFENNINLSKPGGRGKGALLNDLEISLSLDFKNPNNFGLEYTLFYLNILLAILRRFDYINFGYDIGK